MTSRRIMRRTVPPEHQLPAHLHPVTQRVLAARGALDAAMLDVSLQGLHDVSRLGGAAQAAALLAETMRARQRMLVIGDFDADGATATAVAVRGLRAMGARDVDYLVPNRFEYGYGLTPEIVAVARASDPSLIITVDNGVSSIDGVRAANAHGIRVLVTDHHLPGPVLPDAAAIVNPNLPGDAFPSKALAGVGVIFYLLGALRARLRADGWFSAAGIAEPNLADLLDLVALGTVADVVPLDHNNRRLVAQGISRIRAGRCQPGISALIDAAGRERARVSSSDLAFALGPRLNAAGRLADMSIGIECLLSDDAERCAAIAAELDRLNRERREIETEMRDQAFAAIDDILTGPAATRPAGMCMYDETWHQGVVGIVASRVKDRYHRPAIAFAQADDRLIKGSARSIPGLHIRDVLAGIAALHPGLIVRFGGHAMAAGLTLRRADFEVFKRIFADQVADALAPEALEHTILTDGALAADDMTLGLAHELNTAAPWGQAFSEPRFDGEFAIEDRRVVGTAHARLVLRPLAAEQTVAAIAFGAADTDWFRDAETITAVYKLDVNLYDGLETLQLVVDYAVEQAP